MMQKQNVYYDVQKKYFKSNEIWLKVWVDMWKLGRKILHFDSLK